MPFMDDVRGEPAVVRGLVEAYRGPLRSSLERAVRAVGDAGERPLLVLGMGSSLSAGCALGAPDGRLVVVADAGEVLHYGLGAAARAGVVIAISQSGRSYETVTAAGRIKSATGAPVVALVNDPGSPLAGVADIVLPLLAGEEANVATKTYVAAVVVVRAIAEGGVSRELAADLERTAAGMEALVAGSSAPVAANLLAGCASLMIVGRGPSLGAGQYAALTTKECTARPVEAMTGGAFRHGPLELGGPATGIVVLAPTGPTANLGVALALETAALGSPTWLLTGPARAPGTTPNLLVTVLPDLPEPLAALAAVVPLQLMAAELALRGGREPGTTRIATKVTDRE
jgi:glucosamine--fructose-6-phosphate aminotransferase (isomerizing)